MKINTKNRLEIKLVQEGYPDLIGTVYDAGNNTFLFQGNIPKETVGAWAQVLEHIAKKGKEQDVQRH